MASVVDDCISPRELIVPSPGTTTATQPTLSGALFLSGAKLYVCLEGYGRLITSAV